MTLLLRSQRLLAAPELARGDKMTCTDYDGTDVELTVTWPQPPLGNGRWVNGLAGGDPAVVWVSW